MNSDRHVRSDRCRLSSKCDVYFLCGKPTLFTQLATVDMRCKAVWHITPYNTRYTLGERGAARRGKKRRRTRGHLRESEGAERLEAHTSMSRGRGLCASGGGGANAKFRWSDGVSVRVRGAPQTSRLVRRSWSPRVLIYACRCVFQVITGAGVVCGVRAARRGAACSGGYAAAPRLEGCSGDLGGSALGHGMHLPRRGGR